ncbi:MAG: SDR family NAD(P)-dependent oxidoreductase [Bacteroidetes bacterium]|nr:MAG: SDR family NAD(P)-dependent oxidoreductase [Bacteroidota bacterium]
MSNSLENKTAVITGGAGVLCGSIAEYFASSGVKVGILGRSHDTVHQKVEEILERGGEAIPLIADVLAIDQLLAARDKMVKTWGQIDILINGAGGNMSAAVVGPDQSFFNMPMEAFDQVFRLNLYGAVQSSQVFGEVMAMNKKGCILNVSSIAATLPLTRVVGYSAAKASLENFTQWLAVELAVKYGDGIRVNALAPGFFIAKQNRKLLLNEDGTLTQRGQSIISNTPMNRFGEPEDLHGTAAWICSDGARFVTGIVIPVDGGFSAFSGV